MFTYTYTNTYASYRMKKMKDLELKRLKAKECALN